MGAVWHNQDQLAGDLKVPPAAGFAAAGIAQSALKGCPDRTLSISHASDFPSGGSCQLERG